VCSCEIVILVMLSGRMDIICAPSLCYVLLFYVVLGGEVVWLFPTHVVILFRPYGDTGEIALVMLICSLHLSCTCSFHVYLLLFIFSTNLFVHTVVLDISIHMFSEPEHFDLMSIWERAARRSGCYVGYPFLVFIWGSAFPLWNNLMKTIFLLFTVTLVRKFFYFAFPYLCYVIELLLVQCTSCVVWEFVCFHDESSVGLLVLVEMWFLDLRVVLWYWGWGVFGSMRVFLLRFG